MTRLFTLGLLFTQPAAACSCGSPDLWLLVSRAVTTDAPADVREREAARWFDGTVELILYAPSDPRGTGDGWSGCLSTGSPTGISLEEAGDR